MGAASDITEDVIDFFIKVSTTEYPKHWRFQEEHIASFRLGVGFAVDNLNNTDLHLIPLEDEPRQSKTVAQARKDLGISKHELRAYFRKAEMLVPGTRASRRLDTSSSRPDGDLQQDKSRG